MGLQDRMPFRLPGGARLWDRLIGSGFIFVELHDPCRFGLLARELDQSFFSGVCGSYTVTVPLLRTRSAKPVRHHVRVC